MANKKPYRRKKTFLLKGKVDKALTLGTLAASDVVKVNFNDSVDEEAWALSAELVWSLRDLTPGEGPIIVGLAHSDYTDPEIEAFLEAAASWKRGNLTEQEIAKRKIRMVGIFPGEVAEEVLNDGRPIKTKLSFNLITAATVAMWAFNKSGAVLTTGGIITAEGHVWLKPR